MILIKVNVKFKFRSCIVSKFTGTLFAKYGIRGLLEGLLIKLLK